MRRGKNLLLLAALRLSKAPYDGKLYATEFAVELLTVEAWKANPEVFGLRWYGEIYPDHNKVVCYLYGKKGLVRQGFLKKNVSSDGRRIRFALTELGREEAETIKVIAEMRPEVVDGYQACEMRR